MTLDSAGLAARATWGPLSNRGKLPEIVEKNLASPSAASGAEKQGKR